MTATASSDAFNSHVLVVDDSAGSRRKMAMAVRNLGHHWTEMPDGEAALEFLRHNDVDLVLLDIMMPGLDGFGVLEAMRADTRLSAIPVLVISGMDGDMDSVARAIELGAADFLPKDFSAAIFRARVEACIEKKRLRDAELDYLAQVERVSAAAAMMEEKAFHPKNLGLGAVAGRDDSVGRLARVFSEMALQVYDRERALLRSVRTSQGFVLLILAGVIGGMMAPMSALLFQQIPMATGLSFWGDLLPGFLCIGFAALQGKMGRLTRQTLSFLFVWAVLNVVGSIFLFEASGRVSGIILSIILAFQGLCVFLFAAVLRMEEASWRRFMGLLIGLTGAVVLIAVRETGDGMNASLWVLFAISIPVIWAATDIVIAAREPQSTMSPIGGLGVMYLLSAALTLPIALAQGQLFALPPDLGPAFWLILVNTLVDTFNYVFYVLLVLVAGAVFASQAAYVTTLAGIFWSMLLLGEHMTNGAWIALGFIFVGLLVVGPKSEAADMEVQFIPKSRRKGWLRQFVLPQVRPPAQEEASASGTEAATAGPAHGGGADISAQIRAERRLARLIDGARVGTWEHDMRTGRTEISERWAEILGYRAADLNPLTLDRWIALVHPDDIDLLNRQEAQAFAAGQWQIETEIRLRHREGHWVWVLTRTQATEWDASGKPVRTSGVNLDITAAKAMEAALARERDTLAKIMETSVSGIVAVDGMGRVVFANAGAERVLGRPVTAGASLHALLATGEVSDLNGKPILPDDFPVSRASGGQTAQQDRRLTILWPDGQRRILSMNAAPLSGSGIDLAVVFALTDITDAVESEDRLRAAMTAAEAANEAKSHFLATMSHEIRTPMNGIIGMTQLLSATKLDAEQRDYCSTIAQSSEALLSVINDILDFSKIEAGAFDVEQIPFDLFTTVEGTLDVISVRAVEKDLELVYWIDPDQPRWVVGDPLRLRQVILNLTNNAVKFTETGEVFLRVSLAKPMDAGKLTVRFQILDTGIGIPADRLDRLFKSFSQVDASTTRRYGGTGLGLAISKRLVELMGGEISVRSEVGHGTEFFFDLPLGLAEETPAEGDSATAAVQIGGRTAMVVDDNATNRRVLGLHLRTFGMTPIEAPDAETALRMLADGPQPDIVILDMQMPRTDGIELARRIRALPQGRMVPLVLSSSLHVSRSQIGVLDEAGEFAGLLSKPIKPSALLEVIGSALRSDALAAKPAAALAAPHPDQRLADEFPMRILVVDDHPTNRKFCAAALRKLGFEPMLAASGEEAVALAAGTSFDVILMDIEMPDMDGIEATAKIRGQTAGTDQPCFVALTANAIAGDREKYLQAGLDDYVSKPIEIGELVRALRAAATRRTAPRPSGT
ncbi:response regulator [Paragemmobacter straminiformis]|uniref:Sensory/regulatory protein RpfC n=1 Tax=Paragemmobacter straminiformis TaxID=2045119 RepID=A0A842I3M2_9RHOB|nr:response regulator [Gemmobacter straminiformis]MBC2834037.1 response regulator [Gemmobacter straminiformis]